MPSAVTSPPGQISVLTGEEREREKDDWNLMKLTVEQESIVKKRVTISRGFSFISDHTFPIGFASGEHDDQSMLTLLFLRFLYSLFM